MESPKRKMQKKNDYQRHKFFRKIKRRRKAQAEAEQQIAEKQLRKKLKLPKFGDGKNIKSDAGAPLEVKDGMLYYKETGQPFYSAGLLLPEVEVVGDKSKVNPWATAGRHNASSYFDGNWSKDLINMTPGIGDAMDVAQTIADTSNGQYISAGSGLAMLALPNFIEKPFKYIGKRLVPFIKRYLDKINFKDFKSELDWSPDSWFSYRHGGKYTEADAKELASHTKEYTDIEKRAKMNGTWLKNQDGSNFNGDPREWVMANSENAKWLNTSDPFYHGTRGSKKYDPEFNEEVWGANKQEIAATYHNRKNPESEVDKLYYPKNANVQEFDAGHKHWGDIDFRGGKTTTDMAKDELQQEGADVVKIKDVLDLGPENVLQVSKSGFEFGDDYIVKDGLARKSLLGNNGAIKYNDKNIYRALIPLIGAGGLYVSNNSNYNSGKDVYIKKSKRGTFTKAAKQHGMSVQGFANKVLRNPSNYSAAMIKKANFAHNAASWKH